MFKKMTVEEIMKRVDLIEECILDDEAAHSYEDTLHQDVLMAIAKNECDNPASCAMAALLTLKLDFERWCA